MAAKLGPAFYVYRIFLDHETIYVGKGSGRRLANQIRRFRASGEILEHCSSDDEAFKAERKWIAALKPTENKCAGGQGGRVVPKPDKFGSMWRKFLKEYNEIGPRRYVARFLVSRLSGANCESYGVSKVDLNRLRAVANGQWS